MIYIKIKMCFILAVKAIQSIFQTQDESWEKVSKDAENKWEKVKKDEGAYRCCSMISPVFPLR